MGCSPLFIRYQDLFYCRDHSYYREHKKGITTCLGFANFDGTIEHFGIMNNFGVANCYGVANFSFSATCSKVSYNLLWRTLHGFASDSGIVNGVGLVTLSSIMEDPIRELLCHG